MVDGSLKNALMRLAKEGKISCAQALALAQSRRVPAIEVGKAADAAGIKITACQLGCFGGQKEQER